MKVNSFIDVNRALDSIKSQLPVADLLRGHQLKDIELDTSTVAVPHKLGRLPLGYLVVSQDADATLWEGDARNAVNLYLQASGPVTVSLWVF